MAAGVPSGLQGLAVLVIGCKVGALLAHRWVAAGGVAQLAVVVGGGKGGRQRLGVGGIVVGVHHVASGSGVRELLLSIISIIRR